MSDAVPMTPVVEQAPAPEPDGTSQRESPQPPSPQPPAGRKPFRFGWYWWVAIAGAVLVMAVGIVAVVTLFTVNASAPRAAVAQYLQAVERGQATKALALGGVKAGPSDVLLTDKAYGNATKRISGFTLATPVVTGNTASVKAQITQGSHHYSQTFQLVRSGRDLLFVDVWKLKAVPLTRVAIAFDGPEGVPFTIVGRPFSSASDVELRALPGTYNVLIAGEASMNLYTRPFTVTAIGFGSAAPSPAAVQIELSEQGYEAATAAITAFLDTCQRSTQLAPPGCPFHAYSQAGISVDSITWNISKRPQFAIGKFTNGGWAVVGTSLGTAYLTGMAHDTAGRSGEVSTSDISFGLLGTVTFSGDKATYSQLIK